ncbi:MAG: hypothetical protein R2713_14090 [Ilumatobacteraceae bacterium]
MDEWLMFVVLFLPAVLLALSEMSPNMRASRHATLRVDLDSPRLENFTVIVPIYGHIKYLTNVDYLRQYGERVLITTTTAETDEFNAAIEEVCDREGFRLFRGHVPGRVVPGSGGKKSTGGVIREIIVRGTLDVVEHPYVVCIDADTETELRCRCSSVRWRRGRSTWCRSGSRRRTGPRCSSGCRRTSTARRCACGC